MRINVNEYTFAGIMQELQVELKKWGVTQGEFWQQYQDYLAHCPKKYLNERGKVYTAQVRSNSKIHSLSV